MLDVLTATIIDSSNNFRAIRSAYMYTNKRTGSRKCENCGAVHKVLMQWRRGGSGKQIWKYVYTFI
jgi:hypothetical protein